LNYLTSAFELEVKQSISLALNKKKRMWGFIGFNRPFLTIRDMVILLTCSFFATSFVHKYILIKIAQKKPKC
jgi:hypothetical protein